MGEQDGVDTPGAVKSASRALELLDLLTTQSSALSFSDLQEALSYPKASLHGLLRTMTAMRWLSFDATSKKYALGIRVWEAGLAYTKMLPLAALARPIMERVSALTSETVQLAVLDNFEVLYIGKVDGNHLLRLDSSVGLRLQPHATGVGKVLLSGISDESLRRWLERHHLERYTPHTIVASTKLLKELSSIRQTGYATDREERTLGAACVAVGIRNHVGSLVAAMSVSAPAVRFGNKEQAAALRHLQDGAAELSATLGYSSSPVAMEATMRPEGRRLQRAAPEGSKKRNGRLQAR